LIQMVAGWQKTLPELVENTLRNSVRELTAARKEGRAPTSRSHPFVHEFPARVTTEIEAGAEHGKLRLETIPGRALWLFSLRHLLTETVAVLVRHRWTILRPPRGFTWLTSDNPVIRLNYYKPGHYDFEGGWGRDGCELLLPLSPEHLLYTKIGDRPLGKERISEELAKLIQRMTIEHAHRFVFGVDADPIVERIRPRKVDAVVFKEEIQFWKRWHEEQGEAERNLVRGRPPN